MSSIFRIFFIGISIIGFCAFEMIEATLSNSLHSSSYSMPELAVIIHVSIVLKVDFNTKVLSGHSILDIKALKNVNEVLLDVLNLSIESVELEEGAPLEYMISAPVSDFGSKLTVKLPNVTEPGNRLKIKIKYSTDPTASALQWLDPNQTAGKKHPYLFSQCLPIRARSILPCQDTPAVKFTYDAVIIAPEEFTVLMSAIRDENCPGSSEGKSTCFKQHIPIPSYLLALVVGVIESRTLGPRTKVWSEKPEIDQSAWEFADTENYLKAAERLCGPYEWTQYDLLVLPPSFAYGGMENPCLTYVTPTLLAGDRSQADVIIHEIMHSWTGNLVSIQNFEHFWLKEGFTVFMERKVAASLITDQDAAKKYRDFHSLLGLQQLNETVFHELGPTSNFTKLVLDLEGIYPDDVYSSVPYEKGSLFLRYLEDLVGGPVIFDIYLRSYVNRFKMQSIDSDDFKNHFLEYFEGNDAVEQIDWQSWLYGVGMPPVIPNYDTSMVAACTALVNHVLNREPTEFVYDDIAGLTQHQIINFLQQLLERDPLSIDKLRAIGDTYKLKNHKNTEILYRWLRLCARSKDESVLQDILDFVNRQGRMKYVRPIYRDLYVWEEVRERAIQNFKNNEKYMMNVTANSLKKDLHLD